MATISAYWRPTSIARALELLDRPHAVVLAGGTALIAQETATPIEVVDLQALHLDGIDTVVPQALRIGAMASLQHLVDDDRVPPVIREAARRELPSTLRAQATVGGRIATGDWESELLGALLVHDATVRLDGAVGLDEVPLDAVLAALPLAPGRIISSVTIETGGKTGTARTARTPADKAIVAAFVRETDGERLIALSGVASHPVLVSGADGLDPPADFRGSARYRRALAATLLARAVEALR